MKTLNENKGVIRGVCGSAIAESTYGQFEFAIVAPDEESLRYALSKFGVHPIREHDRRIAMVADLKAEKEAKQCQ